MKLKNMLKVKVAANSEAARDCFSLETRATKHHKSPLNTLKCTLKSTIFKQEASFEEKTSAPEFSFHTNKKKLAESS